MLRVAAMPNVACMADVVTLWDIAFPKMEGEPMDTPVPAHEGRHAVTIPIKWALVQPAAVWHDLETAKELSLANFAGLLRIGLLACKSGVTDRLAGHLPPPFSNLP